ncbi:WD40 repeat domain-containing protein [Candidatus Parcubacteria bacterium]|nr:MAG: WD40 repeat domain-containing protein [Candidatus Parcubacteria bacterium]
MRKITYLGLLSIMLFLNLAFTSPPLPPEPPSPTPTPSGWWQGHPVITPDNAERLVEVYRYETPSPFFFKHSPDYRVFVGLYEDGLRFYDRSGHLLAILEGVYPGMGYPLPLGISRNAWRIALVTPENDTVVYQRAGRFFTEIYRRSPEKSSALDYLSHWIALSPDGRLLADGTHSGIKVVDLKNGKLVYSNKSLWGIPTFSPDGQWLAIADFMGNVMLLQVSNFHKPLIQIIAPADDFSFAFSRDSRYLAISTANQIHVWALPERQDVRYISLPLNVGYFTSAWEISLPVSDTIVVTGYRRDGYQVTRVASAWRISTGQPLPVSVEPSDFAIAAPMGDGWDWWSPPDVAAVGASVDWVPKWVSWEDEHTLVWGRPDETCRLNLDNSWDCTAASDYQVAYQRETYGWLTTLSNGLSVRLPAPYSGSIVIRQNDETVGRVTGWTDPGPNHVRLLGRYVVIIANRSRMGGDKYIQSLMVFDPSEKRFVYQWDMAVPVFPEWWQERHLARPCDRFDVDRHGNIYISLSVEDAEKGKYTEIQRITSFDAAPQTVAEIPGYDGCMNAVSPDGSLFVVDDDYYGMRLVDAAGETFQKWHQAEAFAFSPDGRFLAGIQGGGVKVWAVTSTSQSGDDWLLRSRFLLK